MKEDKDTKLKIEQLEKNMEELENSWKRALADYKNLEKRVLEEKETWVTFGNERLITRILPVLDNMEKLKGHMKDEGLNLTVKDLQTALSEFGVTEINPEKKEFDPLTMEAVEVVPGEKNKVVEVLSKGYMLKSKLIRPASVKVGNGEKPHKKEE